METKKELDFLVVKIESDRILLCPVSLEFVDDIFREFTSEITRYMFPSPPTKKSEIVTFVETSRKSMEKGIDLVLIISAIGSGEFLGVCGIHERASKREPELGVWIKKSAHRQLYGREAISYLVKWVRQNIVFNHLQYPVDKDNTPSRKIAEYLGGEIFREGIKKSMSGYELNEVTYKIK